MPERTPSRRATRARRPKSLTFSAGEAGLLGACSGCSDTLLAAGDFRALARDTLPAAAAPDEHVHEPVGGLDAPPLDGSDQVPGKQDDGGIAEFLDDEFVQGRRV